MNGWDTQEGKHTMEPWVQHDPEYCPEEIWGALDCVEGDVRGEEICTVNMDRARGELNARRIVACVNAMAGIDDPESTIPKLRADRAKLVEALKEVDEVLTEMKWHTDRGVLMRVRAVLEGCDAAI